MKSLVNQITDCIERTYDIDGMDFHKKIIVYPYGDVGIQVVNIMRSVYGLEPSFIIDNHKCKYNAEIRPITDLEGIDPNEYVLILSSINLDIYLELRQNALSKIGEQHLIELEVNKEKMINDCGTFFRTKIGKHSYGPICCNHWHIKSIGSFSSFAAGVDVVANHEMNFISMHPMMYMGQTFEGLPIAFSAFKERPWYIEGIQPNPIMQKWKRITIGSDVWLGRNVIITNFANIGNGVVAGAGAVITKDVPDYAVVAGVPARIIRYRYSQDQIESLNRIKWWDWSDDTIKERFDDFYLPVDEFISKYDI